MQHPFIDNILSAPPADWTSEQEAALLEPYTYVASTPGKGFRNILIQAFNHWLQVPPAQLEIINRAVELLHNASLLVDDIEDDSELRRGKPVAHMVYGVPQTINSANYVYFLAYQEIFKLPYVHALERPYFFHPGFPRWNVSNIGLRFIQILNDDLLALHRGQGRELYWRDYLQCPTEEEYIQMAKDKTGGLLRIAVKLMMACSVTANANHVPLVDLLGIWFQIRDDYMNLQSNQASQIYSKSYTENKGFAEDLTEGKFSFPIIHSIREKPDSRQIINVLHQRPKSATLKSFAISYLEEVTHSFEYTRSVLASLEAQARAEVRRLGGNPKLEAILDKMAVEGN